MRKQLNCYRSTATLDVQVHGFQLHECNLHNYFDEVKIIAVAIVSEYMLANTIKRTFERAILQLKLIFI